MGTAQDFEHEDSQQRLVNATQVRLELVGEQSSSGVLRLARGRRSFRPGSEDTFTFPHIPWLGDIRCIRVATDGSGLFPAWHLRCVVLDERGGWADFILLRTARNGYCTVNRVSTE